MDRTAARRVLVAGLVLGVSAEILFDGPAFGINVVLAVIGLLGAGWLVRRRGTAPDPLDTWLPLAAIASAAAVAITGDHFLALLDTIAALAFTGAAIAALSGVAVTRRSAEVVAVIAATALVEVGVGAHMGMVEAKAGWAGREGDAAVAVGRDEGSSFFG